jgi:hypothetical protein
MKTKFILRTTGLLIMIASLFVFSSCTKQADGDLTKEQKEQQGENRKHPQLTKRTLQNPMKTYNGRLQEFYDQLSSTASEGPGSA